MSQIVYNEGFEDAKAHYKEIITELLEALERLWAISDPLNTPDSITDYIEAAISKARGES